MSWRIELTIPPKAVGGPACLRGRHAGPTTWPPWRPSFPHTSDRRKCPASGLSRIAWRGIPGESLAYGPCRSDTSGDLQLAVTRPASSTSIRWTRNLRHFDETATMRSSCLDCRQLMPRRFCVRLLRRRRGLARHAVAKHHPEDAEPWPECHCMLRVTIELVPCGIECRARVIATGKIVNTGTGTPTGQLPHRVARRRRPEVEERAHRGLPAQAAPCLGLALSGLGKTCRKSKSTSRFRRAFRS